MFLQTVMVNGKYVNTILFSVGNENFAALTVGGLYAVCLGLASVSSKGCLDR